MASSSSSPGFLFFFILFIAVKMASTSSSPVLVFPLSHSLANSRTKTAPSHLLKSTAESSAAKFRRHRQVSLPLNPGSDYTMSFNLGSQTISLYMDTGSDVVWLPCHPFECILCEGEYNPAAVPNAAPLNITSSAAAVACKSRACSAVHSDVQTSDLCAIANCPLDRIETSDCGEFSCPTFYYAYGDGSFVGKLYKDSLSLPLSSPAFVLKDFTFACAHSALAEPIGVAGFGRGALSMPAQLAGAAPEMGNYFSYCLVSHSFDSDRVRIPSPLVLGRFDPDAENKETRRPNQTGKNGLVYTAMLKSHKYPYFYYVALDGVSVGKKRIPSPASLRRIDGKGNGGMVVDSGTTYTMLPREFYDSILTEFDNRVGPVYERADDVEGRTGLGPCYYIQKKAKAKVPGMTWHFAGENSSVVMPRRNYFYEFLDGGDGGRAKRNVGCLMLMSGGDDDSEASGGPAGLLGNYQQQGFEVVYDLEKGKVGFAKRKCASLWKTLT